MLIEINCSHCGKKFTRQKGRINEAIKFTWKQYCSRKCELSEKRKRIEFKCGNPNCKNIFYRNPSDIPSSKVCYCSKSCSAIISNKKSAQKRKKIRICPKCGSEFTGRRKYCSSKCFPERPFFPKENILAEINQFFKENGRIPLKNEYHAYKTARHWFGTWNKAIKAAGLDPNPVLFAKKYIANDGHKCDSLSEKIIDDWLFGKGVSHERNIQYPEGKFHFDFKVGNTYVEFFGLHGELKRYDELVKQKLKIIKKNKIKFLAIFPEDLYPKSNLERILKDLLT